MSRKGMTLVTGADGFIGRRVVACLRARGEEYIASDLGGCEIVTSEACDITDPAAVAKLFATHSIESVIHLAAILPSACRVNPELATRVNIVGSLNLLEAAARAKVRRFVFSSSSSVYGLGVGESPVSEQELTKPSDLYGAAKLYVEKLGQVIGERAGMEFIALRIATVVGPGARHTASPWRSEMFEKLTASSPAAISIPAAADDFACLVYVADLAYMVAIVATCVCVPTRVYNTPAESLRFGELKKLIESLNPKITVELNGEGITKAPPKVDGSRFLKDFEFHPLPVTSRLKQTDAPES
jgi:nucleoside-diphosphate-sugar epimerase